MRHDDVEDDFEELRAARVRMMLSDAVWLHRIAHVLNEENPPTPAGWPAKNWGFKMTEDQNGSDSRLEEALHRAHERSNGPMSTPESKRWGEAFMKDARLASITALRRRVAEGELISGSDLQVGLKISAESIDSAVREGRLFACTDPDSVKYYPAFYADPRYSREQIERVTQQLANLPPTVKYHFFVSKAFLLAGKTPLEALVEGRLGDVLRAAAEYAER